MSRKVLKAFKAAEGSDDRLNKKRFIKRVGVGEMKTTNSHSKRALEEHDKHCGCGNTAEKKKMKETPFPEKTLTTTLKPAKNGLVAYLAELVKKK